MSDDFNIKDTFSNLADGADTAISNLEDLAGKFISLEHVIPNAISLIADSGSELRKLNKELGTGSKVSAELASKIGSISSATGINKKAQLELLNVTKDYHQSLNNTSASTLKFIQASGAEVSIIGKLSAKLNILGISSESTFSEMYTRLLAVRDAYGLTSDQIDNVSNTIIKYSTIMQASSNDTINAAESLAYFTSKLTSVGVESSKVTEILDNMLDPDKLTDNLALMSKIGITVNDMVSGDPAEKLVGATEKLRDLGNQISDIAKTNRLQANNLAKIYGLSLEDAISLSKIDLSQSNININKSLDQYRQEITSISESFSNVATMLTGGFVKLMSPFTAVLEAITNTMSMLPKALTGVVSIWAGKKIIGLLGNVFERLGGRAAKGFANGVSKNFGPYFKEIEKRLDIKSKDAESILKNSRKAEIDYSKYGDLTRKQRKNLEETGFVTRSAKEQNKINKQIRKKAKGIDVDNTAASAIAKNYLPDLMQRKFIGDDEYFELLSKNKDDRTAKERKKFYTLGQQRNAFYNKIFDTNRDQQVFDTDTYVQVKEGKAEFKENKDDFFKKYFNDVNDNIKDIIEKNVNLLAVSSTKDEFLNNLLEKTKTEFDNTKDETYKTKLQSSIESLEEAIGANIQATTSTVDKTKYEEINKKLNKINSNPEGKAISNKLGTILKWAGGIAGGAATFFLSSMMKNEKIQESLSEIKQAFSDKFSSIIQKTEPMISSLVDLTSSVLDFISPAIDAIANALGRFSNWVSRKLGNISSQISPISDNYKNKNLSEMTIYEGRYDADTKQLIGAINDVGDNVKAVIASIIDSSDSKLP